MKNKMISLAVIGMLSITMLTGCASTNEVEEAPKSSSNTTVDYSDKSMEFKYGYKSAEKIINEGGVCDFKAIIKGVDDYLNIAENPNTVKYLAIVEGFVTCAYDNDLTLKDGDKELTLEEAVQVYMDDYDAYLDELEADEVYVEEPVEEEKPVVKEPEKNYKVNPDNGVNIINEYVDREIGTACIVECTLYDNGMLTGKVIEEGEIIATVWLDLNTSELTYELYY